jgi:pimeloyl-ACP methyl ester carboxylesterase
MNVLPAYERGSLVTPDGGQIAYLKIGRGPVPLVVIPVLVVGGEADHIILARVMREMAESIPNSQLKLYADYGHGNDVTEFVQTVLETERIMGWQAKIGFSRHRLSVIHND